MGTDYTNSPYASLSAGMGYGRQPSLGRQSSLRNSTGSVNSFTFDRASSSQGAAYGGSVHDGYGGQPYGPQAHRSPGAYGNSSNNRPSSSGGLTGRISNSGGTPLYSSSNGGPSLAPGKPLMERSGFTTCRCRAAHTYRHGAAERLHVQTTGSYQSPRPCRFPACPVFCLHLARHVHAPCALFPATPPWRLHLRAFSSTVLPQPHRTQGQQVGGCLPQEAAGPPPPAPGHPRGPVARSPSRSAWHR